MSVVFEPPPTWAFAEEIDPQTGIARFNPVWLNWFVKLIKTLNAAGGGGGGGFLHNSLLSIDGGTSGQYFHLTSARYNTLTGVQGQGTVFAGPQTGADAVATFRPLAQSDLPAGLWAPGLDGMDGEDGWMGPPGFAGSNGRDGQPGMDGFDGEDGEPGFPGARGATGAAGRDGIPGEDGQDGEVAYLQVPSQEAFADAFAFAAACG